MATPESNACRNGLIALGIRRLISLQFSLPGRRRSALSAQASTLFSLSSEPAMCPPTHLSLSRSPRTELAREPWLAAFPHRDPTGRDYRRANAAESCGARYAGACRRGITGDTETFCRRDRNTTVSNVDYRTAESGFSAPQSFPSAGRGGSTRKCRSMLASTG